MRIILFILLLIAVNTVFAQNDPTSEEHKLIDMGFDIIPTNGVKIVEQDSSDSEEVNLRKKTVKPAKTYWITDFDKRPMFSECIDDSPRPSKVIECNQEEVMNFLRENIEFREEEESEYTSGKITVAFVIYSDGTVSKPDIVESSNYLLNKKVLDGVKLMFQQHPIWTPGMVRGYSVSSNHEIEVTFLNKTIFTKNKYF